MGDLQRQPVYSYLKGWFGRYEYRSRRADRKVSASRDAGNKQTEYSERMKKMKELDKSTVVYV